MNGISKLIMIFEGIGMVIALVIIVYLIIRRRKIKKEENFDRRSN